MLYLLLLHYCSLAEGMEDTILRDQPCSLGIKLVPVPLPHSLSGSLTRLSKVTPLCSASLHRAVYDLEQILFSGAQSPLVSTQAALISFQLSWPPPFSAKVHCILFLLPTPPPGAGSGALVGERLGGGWGRG